MQDSSAFQFLAIDTIHESTTNPRRTFDEAKLYELAESIKHNGLIQPITVRPNNQGFEIVAGARRYRAAQLAELFSVPARIVEIDDAKALEWQLVENSQRVDVHPYEEAQGFQRLLDMPGYDVAALVEKSGKSASHVYARLSLLQLIPTVAEAFTQERITASHANLHRPSPAGEPGRRLRAVLAEGLAGQRAAPATRQARSRVDTGQPLSVSCGCTVRPRRPHPQPRRRSLRHLPPPQRTQHRLFCDVQGDQCLDSPATTARLRHSLTGRLQPTPDSCRSRTAGVIPRSRGREPCSAATSGRSRQLSTTRTRNQ